MISEIANFIFVKYDSTVNSIEDLKDKLSYKPKPISVDITEEFLNQVNEKIILFKKRREKKKRKKIAKSIPKSYKKKKISVPSDYWDDDDYEIYFDEETYLKIKEAEEKNERLISNLATKRTSFAGIGTNKAKRRLNKLAEKDIIAKALRIALEIEDKNIQAKNSYGKYKTKIYQSK